ncbi:hypothetical protein K502DRAFT_319723 [Neoconidiobolus thromboides FSU 785]|nr:hypothetical protein K502DRAFT_319723 [Neoconidiobolus thromboides FSU 785]
MKNEIESYDTIDGFLLSAIKIPKDRLFLLKLDKELEAFILDERYRTELEFPQMNSYQRRVIHRIADYFKLEHNLDKIKKTMILNKTGLSEIPIIRISDLIENEVETPTISLKIMQRKNGNTIDKKELTKKEANLEKELQLRLELREARYQEARARIFNQSPTSSIASVESKISNLQLDTCSQTSDDKNSEIRDSTSVSTSVRSTNGNSINSNNNNSNDKLNGQSENSNNSNQLNLKAENNNDNYNNDSNNYYYKQPQQQSYYMSNPVNSYNSNYTTTNNVQQSPPFYYPYDPNYNYNYYPENSLNENEYKYSNYNNNNISSPSTQYNPNQDLKYYNYNGNYSNYSDSYNNNSNVYYYNYNYNMMSYSSEFERRKPVRGRELFDPNNPKFNNNGNNNVKINNNGIKNINSNPNFKNTYKKYHSNNRNNPTLQKKTSINEKGLLYEYSGDSYEGVKPTDIPSLPQHIIEIENINVENLVCLKLIDDKKWNILKKIDKKLDNKMLLIFKNKEFANTFLNNFDKENKWGIITKRWCPKLETEENDNNKLTT